MTRDLYIMTKSEIRRYVLKKNTRPLTVLNYRLYRTDDRLMIADRASNHQMVVYDLESTQPHFSGPVDPDETMAYIEIAKQSGKRAAVSKLGILNSIGSSWLMYGLVAAIVVYAIVTGGGVIA